MRSIRDIEILEGIPVLVRAPLNVPIENECVVNDYRLRRALPTIKYLAGRGAKVVLISHIGENGTETLKPVAEALGQLMPNVSFSPEVVGESARNSVRALAPGSTLVMENLRRHKEEQANDPAFAKELAQLADVFVEDSFDTCHRLHASIISVPTLLPSYAGFLLEEEMAALRGALNPPQPSVAVIGGAKFSTKEAAIAALLARYMKVFVGGALANDFLKASGQEVGKSLVSGTDLSVIKKLLENPKLVLPVDSLVVKTGMQNSIEAKEAARVRGAKEVEADEIILDHGPATRELLAELVGSARGILWNGPLGNYEKGFIDSTDALARAIGGSEAHSVVGGGDTVASIQNLGLLPHFSFVSTGGGAMLDFLAKGSLPGIDVLETQPIA